MKAIVLEIRSGKDKGVRARVDVGHCLAFVRSTRRKSPTMMMSADDVQAQEREDRRVVEAHLKTRAPGLAGARDLFDSFEHDLDLGLSDESVSERHAMLFVDEAGVSLLDLGSTNGTYVNGTRINDADLVDGDVIRVGQTRIELRAARV